MSLKLEGVYSVLPTPFTAAGDVDEASLRRVVDLFIGAGVNGVTALGVTGEVARLDDASGAACSRSSSSRSTAASASWRARRRRARGPASTTAGTRRRPARRPSWSARRGCRSSTPTRWCATSTRSRKRSTSRSSCRTIRRSPATRWSRALLARIAREIPRARTIKLEDPPTPFKTSRILAIEKIGGVESPDLRRPRRRVPARGADGRRDRRDDRVRVPGDPRADRRACSAPGASMTRPTCSTARCR